MYLIDRTGRLALFDCELAEDSIFAEFAIARPYLTGYQVFETREGVVQVELPRNMQNTPVGVFEQVKLSIKRYLNEQ